MILRGLLVVILWHCVGPVVATEKPVVLLSGLTETGLDDLEYLLDHNLLPLADKVSFQAIFLKKDHTTSKEVEGALRGHKGFSVITPDCTLSPEHLFERNGCSEFFSEWFDRSVGVIFLGGYDLPAKIYSSRISTLTLSKTPDRSYFELSFLYHLLGGNRDKALSSDQRATILLERRKTYCVFGICLGLQTMNVANGGTLHQDIPQELYGTTVVADLLALDPVNVHRNYLGNAHPERSMEAGVLHPIVLELDGWFANLVGLGPQARPWVLSNHHQAIAVLGPDYQVAARSPDGKVIEAIQHKRYTRVFGVQFHPEKRRLYDEGIVVSLDGAPTKGNRLREAFQREAANMVFVRSLFDTLAAWLLTKP